MTKYRKAGTKDMRQDEYGRKWYKGNLHTHTTNSDGRLAPEVVINLYKEAGYDFLALTDHWIFGERRKEEKFLLIPGVEYDISRNVREGIYHIVGIGMKEDPGLLKSQGLHAQEMIDAIHAHDGIAILAHPAWSINRASEARFLEGLDGSEIYNTTSGLPWNCRPYSGTFLDEMATYGRMLPCMAADDAHHYTGDETRSYLMVQASELTEESILEAIRANRFYASQGPDFRVEVSEDGKEITVYSTPVEAIVFFTDTVWAGDRATTCKNVQKAVYQVKPNDTFVRIELQDAQGNMAWSGFYPVNQK